jgi:hypothetical protein
MFSSRNLVPRSLAAVGLFTAMALASAGQAAVIRSDVDPDQIQPAISAAPEQTAQPVAEPPAAQPTQPAALASVEPVVPASVSDAMAAVDPADDQIPFSTATVPARRETIARVAAKPVKTAPEQERLEKAERSMAAAARPIRRNRIEPAPTLRRIARADGCSACGRQATLMLGVGF